MDRYMNRKVDEWTHDMNTWTVDGWTGCIYITIYNHIINC